MNYVLKSETFVKPFKPLDLLFTHPKPIETFPTAQTVRNNLSNRISPLDWTFPQAPVFITKIIQYSEALPHKQHCERPCRQLQASREGVAEIAVVCCI